MTARLMRSYPDNRALQAAIGPTGDHLKRISALLAVDMDVHGNEITVTGAQRHVDQALTALDSLYHQSEKAQFPEQGDVDAAVRLAGADQSPRQGESGPVPPTDRDPGQAMPSNPPTVKTRKRSVIARTPTQAAYLSAMQTSELVFGLGPAGTGKTYLAVAMAVAMKLEGKVDRIVLCRPAVEAGERIGYLPGDMREKVDPYLRPMIDALRDMMPADEIERRMAGEQIEIAPLAFMRGRTLAHAFVILDEAQNTTAGQMKMFLTRLGEGSRMVITGDPSQVDLPVGSLSGLQDALSVLGGMQGMEVVRFGERDVVRHDLVARIVASYDQRDRQRSGNDRGDR